MKLQLRFFAGLRERVGKREAEQEIDEGATVADLWATLCRESPQLSDYTSSVSFAVNREYVDSDYALKEGDEVALIPPVSGG